MKPRPERAVERPAAQTIRQVFYARSKEELVREIGFLAWVTRLHAARAARRGQTLPALAAAEAVLLHPWPDNFDRPPEPPRRLTAW